MAEPTLFPESGFRRLRLDIAYDGTNFSGWATQPGKRTMQDMVEEAISRIVRYDVDSIVAGRTDAGVHATGQVIHIDIPDIPFADNMSFIDLRYKLNRILDEDIRISRLISRHIAFGKDPESAKAWAKGSDQANADLIEASVARCDFVIHS